MRAVRLLGLMKALTRFLTLALVLGAASAAPAAEAGSDAVPEAGSPPPAASAPLSGGGPVFVIELADTINPGAVQFVLRGIKEANQAEAALLVLRLDTPGGVVDAMRALVQALQESRAPVVVFVAPAGARATSAGAFLVMAGHLAAMAPATHLGAASPVAAGGQEIEGTMAKKALSDLAALMAGLAKRRGRDAKLAEAMVTEARSFDAAEARDLKLIDLVVPDLGALLTALEGKVVETAAGPRRIASKGRTLRFVTPDWRDRLLSALANPNLAYILMMIGLAGIYFEFSHPGTILPGVVGALSLILAFFAMSALPVSYAGLALLGLGVVLFIAEIKVASYGLLSLGGAVCLLLGSLMLFDAPGEFMAVSLGVLLPTVITTIAFFGGVAYLAGRAQLAQPTTGLAGLLGQRAVVVDAGRVRVLGELWRAEGCAGLAPGSEVEVVAAEGLSLKVRPPGSGPA